MVAQHVGAGARRESTALKSGEPLAESVAVGITLADSWLPGS